MIYRETQFQLAISYTLEQEASVKRSCHRKFEDKLSANMI